MDGKAYSSNGRDGTISIVAETMGGHFETLKTVPTSPGARTIAVDPVLHALYTPTADFKPGANSTSRPEPIAHTFRLPVLNDVTAH